MDPVTLIVAALVAGASSGLKDSASAAVKDSYAGLKSLLRRHFGRDGTVAPPPVEQGIAAIEQDQAADTSELASALQQSGAANDAELVAAAARLLEKADPEGAAAGKYSVVITDSKGVVVHNQGSVTMTFSDGD